MTRKFQYTKLPPFPSYYYFYISDNQEASHQSKTQHQAFTTRFQAQQNRIPISQSGKPFNRVLYPLKHLSCTFPPKKQPRARKYATMSQQAPSSPEEVAAQQTQAPIRIPHPTIPGRFDYLAISPRVLYKVDDNDGRRRDYYGMQIVGSNGNARMIGTWKIESGGFIFERSGFRRAGGTNMTNGGS